MATKKELKDEWEKVNKQLNFLYGNDVTSDKINHYVIFTNLPQQEQEKITQDWLDYYESAKRTPLAKNFTEQVQHMKAGRLDKVKELVDKVDDLPKYTITKPKFKYDPYMFTQDGSIISYKFCVGRKKYLDKQMEEVDEFSL